MMRLLFLCLGLVFSFFVQAQPAADSLFQQGHKAYAEQNYSQAVQAYEAILEQGMTSATLQNNLGLAYLGQKDLGNAILHFERALRSDPSLEDAQHNLKVARQYQVDEIYPLEPFVLIAWWQQLRNAASSNTWAILCLLAIFAFAAAWIWRWQKGKSWLIPMTILLAGFLFGSLALQSYQEATHRDTAIVVTEEAALHKAPQIGSTHLRSLHAGAKVELLEQEGDWQRIRLVNAQLGWILVELVEPI